MQLTLQILFVWVIGLVSVCFVLKERTKRIDEVSFNVHKKQQQQKTQKNKIRQSKKD